MTRASRKGKTGASRHLSSFMKYLYNPLGLVTKLSIIIITSTVLKNVIKDNVRIYKRGLVNVVTHHQQSFFDDFVT